MFPKIRNMATRIKTDGAATLGAIIGFMVGVYLAYKGLHLTTLSHISNTVILEAVSLMFLSTVFGVIFGAMFDTRHQPRVDQTDVYDSDRQH